MRIMNAKIMCDKELIFTYLEDALAPEEKTKLECHLKDCKDCQRVYDKSKALLEMLEEIKFNPWIVTEECLDIEDLASYAFGEMADKEKEKVDKHILSCDHCLYEIINLRAAEESIPEEPVCKPLPDSMLIDYYSNALKMNLQEIIPDSYSLPLRKAACATAPLLSIRKASEVTNLHENIGIYEICLTSKSGETALLEEGTCSPELLPIRNKLLGKLFHYKVFGVIKDEIIKELKSGSQKYPPIKIKLPDNNPMSLVVFVSHEKIALEKINKDLLLNIYAGKPCEPLNDVICIFVTIKRD